MCNPFPLQCWTDYSPLTWVKHTSGPVSQFIIDMLSQVDYEMNYLEGEDNVIADGLSRFPMLQAAVNKAEKITFLAAGLTWLIHGIKLEDGYKQVYVNNRVTPEIELDVLTRQLADSI